MLKKKNSNIKLVRQHDLMDCGPASLSMITNYYGNKFSLHSLRSLCQIGKDGVSMLGIIHAAKKIGFKPKSIKLKLSQLVENFISPCVLYWNKNHFLVLESISKSKGGNKFHVLDPAHGRVILSEKEFKEPWLKEEDFGIALFLNPTEEFYTKKDQNNIKERLKHILVLFSLYKKKIGLLMFFVLIGSILSIALPFLTEALIDKGVNTKNLNYVSLILLAQLFVFLGIMGTTILRNWYTLVVGAKFSIDIIYSYLSKILKLPMSFFDTKNSGDFNQRIQDNVKIEEFFTSDSILTIFSILTLIIYSVILLYYDLYLFLIYFGLTVVAVYWSSFWLKKRKLIDYQLFRVRAENQEAVYEFYNGIKEMKLNQYEDYKKDEWINLQKRLLTINIKSLKIEQFQSIGFIFFNQLKNILVTFLAANYVIKDSITLGALLSVSFIIGQMNSPIQQLLTFLRSKQDALLSFDRLSEVYTHEEEEKESDIILKLNNEPVNIELSNVNFKYNILSRNYILNDINLSIPKGKVTAIVGHSGSGKTTLMKLLLKFFPTSLGDISYGNHEIREISAKSIRKHSGIVMQDGYIFNDTIERNIALKEEVIDREKLFSVLKAVNLDEFVNSLALKEKTRIGSGGNDVSGGQKQRILIARAIYKDPKYIFLDEATSALDATNEKQVHNNLKRLFKNKTVVIIAHRLSTVQDADQIVVLSKGSVVEQGTHLELINNKNHYYTLVKNQLNI
jgi:ATP-binding cassette subfamily B protein